MEEEPTEDSINAVDQEEELVEENFTVVDQDEEPREEISTAADQDMEVDRSETDVQETGPVDNQSTAQEKGEAEKMEVQWRVRVCPIIFNEMCIQTKAFLSVMKLTTFFEYRMSHHLHIRMEPEDKNLTWVPSKMLYRSTDPATAGMLEMKVKDSDLVELMTILRCIADLSKNKRRQRYELQRLSPDPAQAGEEKTEDGREILPEGTETTDLLVNVGIRLVEARATAFSHPSGYELKEEDKQIYLSRIPAEVPDNVLSAIMGSKLLERQTAEDGTSTAVFHVDSSLGAQGYMETYDGILVNCREVEMSTTLGTLYDARKKQSEKGEKIRLAAESKKKAVKRKPEGSPEGPQSAKKPREDLDPLSQIWIKGREVSQASFLTLKESAKTPVLSWSAMRARGGLRGRAGFRGALAQRGLVRGARGSLQRDALGGTLQRGALQRGAGRGAPMRGAGRGALRGVAQRGAGPGVRGASRGRVFMRGGSRGAPGRGGRPMQREPISPRGGRGRGGYPRREDLQARGREMGRPHKGARMDDFYPMDRGAAYRDIRLSPRGGFDPRMDYFEQDYGDRFDQGGPRPRRRR